MNHYTNSLTLPHKLSHSPRCVFTQLEHSLTDIGAVVGLESSEEVDKLSLRNLEGVNQSTLLKQHISHLSGETEYIHPMGCG